MRAWLVVAIALESPGLGVVIKGDSWRRAHACTPCLPSFMGDLAEEQLIGALQQRLHRSGQLPKPEAVRAAVAMARDKGLSIAAACDSQQPKVPRGSRDRVKGYRDEINSKGLLAACAPPPPPPELPPPINWPQHNADQLKQHYPQLQPPCCPACGNECELAHLYDFDQYDVCCDECGHGPFPNSIYWIGEACTDACREKPWNEKSCFRFKYALCHACTPETAQIDWTSPLVGHWVNLVYGNDRIEFHTPEEADEFYGSLTVENSDFAMDLSNHAAVASEVRTAKALLLPCHMPDLANSPDRYFSRLLVSKEWIALNAPNICMRSVSRTRDQQRVLMLFSTCDRGARGSRRDASSDV
jgi:hypothetical protein